MSGLQVNKEYLPHTDRVIEAIPYTNQGFTLVFSIPISLSKSTNIQRNNY
jgi:hypothetical protein